MADSLQTANERLAEARRTGDPRALAEALTRHANELVLRGQLREARTELDEATDLHLSQTSTYDASRCAQLAAALYRLTGELAAARQRAQRALDTSGGNNPAAVAALAELGDISMAGKQAQAAAATYTQALDLGHSLGPNPPAEVVLLRHRAMAHALMGDQRAAADDLEQALARLEPGGDAATARRVRVELATACQDGGETERASALIEATWLLAEQAADHAVLADLALLRATQALNRRDAVTALADATRARDEALAGSAPNAYIAAVMAVTQLGDVAGDRLGAYAALASGWVTLTDLLGPDLARKTFQPKLLDLHQRWGADAFDAVKREYETLRRQAMEEDKP